MDHKDCIIEVVYICTGDYSKYAPQFVESLKFFFPGYRKVLRIISDRCDELVGFHDDDVIITTLTKKPNMIFPCVPIHKFSWVKEMLDCTADYVFYFDADTIFREKVGYNWEHILDLMDKSLILLSKHPCYLLTDEESLKAWLYGFYIDNPTKDPQYASYIASDEYVYVITSFFAANKRIMGEFCEKVISLQLEDMTRRKSYYIPKFIDENYVNMLLDKTMRGEYTGFDFYVGEFNVLYHGEGIPMASNFGTGTYDTDSAFMFQKNMKNYKTNQR